MTDVFPLHSVPSPPPGITPPPAGWASGDTPIQRLLSLLELVATREAPATLQTLTEETGLPKPTVHRMLQQLEDAAMVVRDEEGRRYTTGVRMRHLAERTLLTDVRHGARHRVLVDLVADLGESCNLTALAGDEVIYLDRVETPEPLRFTLAAGSRVPAHASASGKLLLSQLGERQRARLLTATPLRSFTSKTIVDPDRVEAEIRLSAERGYAIDDEEFLPGLVCAAVLVPAVGGTSNLGLAVQAPALRLPPGDCERLIPTLNRAAAAIARIDAEETA